jgi:hypothetical protein
MVQARHLPVFMTKWRSPSVHQVLPERMMLLAEPSPAGLIDAVEEAMRRVADVDRIRQHEEVGLSIYLSGCLPAPECLSIFLSVWLPAWPVRGFVRPPIHPFIRPSVCPGRPIHMPHLRP